MTAQTKPVVKYRRYTFKFCGRTHKTRSKLTLLATFNGALAKKIRDVSNDGGLTWSYYGAKGKEKLELYEDQKIEDKILEEKGT